MIIAGTGHRPNKLGGYSQEAFNKLVEIATKYLIETKPNKVISGMALGWDQALAQASINLQIPFIAAIPFEDQPNIWSEVQQNYYFDLLSKAEKVHVISQGGFAAYKMQRRNEWMIDNCNLVLAMYDGTKGGTHNCIEYAKLNNKTIVNLFDRLK